MKIKNIKSVVVPQLNEHESKAKCKKLKDFIKNYISKTLNIQSIYLKNLCGIFFALKTQGRRFFLSLFENLNLKKRGRKEYRSLSKRIESIPLSSSFLKNKGKAMCMFSAS